MNQLLIFHWYCIIGGGWRQWISFCISLIVALHRDCLTDLNYPFVRFLTLKAQLKALIDNYRHHDAIIIKTKLLSIEIIKIINHRFFLMFHTVTWSMLFFVSEKKQPQLLNKCNFIQFSAIKAPASSVRYANYSFKCETRKTSHIFVRFIIPLIGLVLSYLDWLMRIQMQNDQLMLIWFKMMCLPFGLC